MKIICSVYNGFLVQQNRDTGMPTYFLPMAPGSRKTWGSRTRDFWCCFGTMIQAQTLYPELIWYTDDSDVFVSQYIPSEVELELSSGSVHLTQCIHIKNYDNQVLFDDHCGGRVSRWSIPVYSLQRFRRSMVPEAEDSFMVRGISRNPY